MPPIFLVIWAYIDSDGQQHGSLSTKPHFLQLRRLQLAQKGMLHPCTNAHMVQATLGIRIPTTQGQKMVIPFL